MCAINRYTGRCSFIKIGAAPTFIKRGKEVYEFKSNTLPIGVFDKMDYDEQGFQLQDKDVVIMVTDGLGDSMNKYYDWKDKFKHIVSNIDIYNPHRIVEIILEQGLDRDSIVDDITILVGVIWNVNN
jgi:stage II sporulation protein E